MDRLLAHVVERGTGGARCFALNWRYSLGRARRLGHFSSSGAESGAAGLLRTSYVSLGLSLMYVFVEYLWVRQTGSINNSVQCSSTDRSFQKATMPNGYPCDTCRQCCIFNGGHGLGISAKEALRFVLIQDVALVLRPVDLPGEPAQQVIKWPGQICAGRVWFCVYSAQLPACLQPGKPPRRRECQLPRQRSSRYALVVLRPSCAARIHACFTQAHRSPAGLPRPALTTRWSSWQHWPSV